MAWTSLVYMNLRNNQIDAIPEVALKCWTKVLHDNAISRIVAHTNTYLPTCRCCVCCGSVCNACGVIICMHNVHVVHHCFTVVCVWLDWNNVCASLTTVPSSVGKIIYGIQ